jgi:hypothetical protein
VPERHVLAGENFPGFSKIFSLPMAVREWESWEQQIPPLRCGMTTKRRMGNDNQEGNDKGKCNREGMTVKTGGGMTPKEGE